MHVNVNHLKLCLVHDKWLSESYMIIIILLAFFRLVPIFLWVVLVTDQGIGRDM